MKEFCILAGFAFGIMSSVGAADERPVESTAPASIGTMTNPAVMNAIQLHSNMYIPDSVRYIPPGLLFH